MATFKNLFKEEELKLEDKIISINGESVAVKQYLPIEQKLKLAESILIQCVSNSEKFFNQMHFDMIKIIETIKFYTDIEFTEEELNNIEQLYDILIQSNILMQIVEAIPADEKFDLDRINVIVRDYYNYKNSLYGVMEGVTQKYENLELNSDEIQKKIADPDNITLLKNIMEKLG